MKNKFPLIVAIIIGVAALFAIQKYVKNMQQQAADQLKGQQVVAARVDIPAGTVITTEMLYPQEVPTRFIPAQAIQGSDNVKLMLGSKTAVAIKAGQLILWSDLVTETRGGLSSIIPAGQGAFTVNISAGVKSDLIQPSDHIDIIGTFMIPKPTQPISGPVASWRQASDLVNVVLLQNVTVLAVGGNYNGAAGAGGGGGDLTLSLTLPEAQEVMFAAQNGQLGAVLRRGGSTDVTARADLPRITFESIDKIIGDLDEQRNYRSIEVQKGGSQNESVPVKINQ
ncbi:MAG TPA: Flp pilus assembly protein CpaB [Pseudomonadales bacterium]|nr:Flp pilus assembly protein CpaB [Pseudomonadales bacterium]